MAKEITYKVDRKIISDFNKHNNMFITMLNIAEQCNIARVLSIDISNTKEPVKTYRIILDGQEMLVEVTAKGIKLL